MTDLFEQTVQVLVALAMSEDAEKLDDAALNREVDPLIERPPCLGPHQATGEFPSEGIQRTRRACASVLGEGAPDTD